MSIQFFNEAAFGGFPMIQRLNTTNTLAEVLAAGWLNSPISEGFVTSPNNKLLITYGIGGTVGVDFFNMSVSNGVWTVVAADSSVVLPVVSGNFAVFSGTSGAIADLGYLPSDATKTVSVMAASAVQVGYLAHFIDTAGTVDDTAGAVINAGTIQSGLSGTVGGFIAYPATAANGTFNFTPVNAGGAFNTTVSNGTMGQSTVYTLPDILAATGGIVVSTAAVRLKSVAAAAAAGGAAAQSFSDAFCTSGSNVIGCWNTQTNAASVLKIVPGNGSFVVTSSADAGVGTFNYVIMK